LATIDAAAGKSGTHLRPRADRFALDVGIVTPG